MSYSGTHSAWRTTIALPVVIACVAALFTVLSGVPGPAATAHADTADAQFHTITPFVLADTRNGTGGVPVAKLPPGATITFQAAGAGAIPATGVSAVVTNLSVYGANAFGWINAYPSDEPTTVSTLTYAANETTNTEDFTKLTGTGQITVKNNGSGTVDIAVSARGYFLDAASSTAGNEYYPVDTAFLYDTRVGKVTGSPAHAAAPIPANSSVTVDVAGQLGIPATGATAVALNVAALNQTAQGALTVRPSDQTDTNLPVVNYNPSETDSSFVVTQLTATGKLIFRNSGTGPVDLAVSVRGYFKGAADGDGSTYTPTATTLLLDTIAGLNTSGGSTAAVAAGQTLTFDAIDAAGLGSVDQNNPVLALNIDARQPTHQGWLAVYPTEDGDPLVNSVNFDNGGESTNGFDLVKPDSHGKISITNHSGGTVHLQVSLRGYFTIPAPAEETTEGIDDESNEVPDGGASADGGRYIDIVSIVLWQQRGEGWGWLYWAGSAPYRVSTKFTVQDESADSYCIAMVIYGDGKNLTNKEWAICGAANHRTLNYTLSRRLYNAKIRLCRAKWSKSIGNYKYSGCTAPE
ncbi:hypothetical protein AGRA3207_002527 [Actinomadura graeca]|uniref:Uncharacterized protein n=1 Tax=Actinomadura graeca TaxID=2750812 RepID=A0ABX8QV88_9ACTN|nr:hypothetical protein [Actinomadura graeca]QXJ21652.1 hypothetical protein AGRA3207_002527 [Actinomadura graeca]